MFLKTFPSVLDKKSRFFSFLFSRYYDERDCEEAYRHGTVILHGRELTVEFARGSRKSGAFFFFNFEQLMLGITY